MGYCSDGWWLNQQFCCWEIEGEETDACDSWHPWSTVTVARWLIYVLFAVRVAIRLPSRLRIHEIDYVFFHCCSLGPIFGQIRSRFWYLGDQVHLGWIRYARIPRFRNILYKERYLGGLHHCCRLSVDHNQPLVIASGLSVGKEGPSVHVACCIGSLVAGMFPKFIKSQGMLATIPNTESQRK